MARALVVAGFVLASLAGHGVAFLWFAFEACGTFDDTGGPFPADWSPQGRICARPGGAAWLDAVPFVVFGLTLLIGVAVVTRASRRSARAGTVAALAGLVAPFLAGWVLALPSDECSPAQQRADRHDHCVTAN